MEPSTDEVLVPVKALRRAVHVMNDSMLYVKLFEGANGPSADCQRTLNELDSVRNEVLRLLPKNDPEGGFPMADAEGVRKSILKLEELLHKTEKEVAGLSPQDRRDSLIGIEVSLDIYPKLANDLLNPPEEK
jgi:hypothetical protein